jgi:very-short-patch-repair endonuclease
MTSKRINYNPALKAYARDLRKNGTKGEALLWKKVLRAKNMEGYQFNRQFPIGNYIVDFICRKLNLIIEIDGSSHLTKGPEDKEREDFLENLGFTILHFPEMEIVHRIDDVIKDIYHAIKCLEENLKKQAH